jgi:hypothetical protein
MQVVCNSAPENTLGSVLLGLGNKLRAFTLDEARQVMALPSHEELQEGVKLIDFAKLREPGTAVFIVVPEGATEVYKEFLATFFGQAIFQLRLDNTREPEHPCLVLIDEARELDVAEVRRIAGIGRGRGIGMALSYQDYPQVLDQYGDKGAKAILETMMTKIFLPGVNGETANYASDLLGKTTIHTETSVDYQGTDKDNTRYSEAGRALMLPDEIRQMPKFRQLLVVTDTAPPVKAAFPPVYLRKDIQKAVALRKPEVLRLADSKIFGGGNFNLPVNSNKNAETLASEVSNVPKKQAKTKRAKNKSVAVSSVGNAVAVLEPDSIDDQLEFESEITDRALDEIGERMADFETTNENGDDEEVLALADDETSGDGERDFMQQELKTFLTSDGGEPKTPTQFESDLTKGGEVTDCFDSETVLRSREIRNSTDEAPKNQEITLTANVALTANEAAREKRRARQTLESEDEFYNALVQRVL